MKTTSLVALVTAAALASFSLPAVAANSLQVEGDTADQVWAEEVTLNRLHEAGINAVAAEDWGGLIRAFVVQPDGTESMEFYSPRTLAPVAL